MCPVISWYNYPFHEDSMYLEGERRNDIHVEMTYL